MRKFTSVLLAFILTFASLSGLFAKDVRAEESTMASQEEVTAIAVNMMMNTFPFEDGMHTSFKLKGIEEIYDINGNIVSYYVTFEDLEGNYCGYVIVNASKLQNPVMEFSVGAGSFIESSKKSLAGMSQGSKLVYLDNGVYGIRQADGKLYEIADAGCVAADEKALRSALEIQLYSDENSDNYMALWDEQLEAYNSVYGNDKLRVSYLSNGPSEGDFIYNPEEYEYTSAIERIVPGGNMYYFTMIYFSEGGVCMPTAATNLCYYWYRRDSSHFAGLYRDSWQNVFNTLAEYMATTSSGTNCTDAYNGFRWYFNEAGLRYSLNYTIGTNNGQLIVDEINAGYPTDLVLSNADEPYQNHSVFAIGYKQFNYASGSSIYIRIADGWGENVGIDTIHLPNRYVWNGSQGTWEYFSFRPEGY